MKKISRNAIQRMVSGISSSSSVISGGGGGGGGVSQYWVDENYISKEFFNKLFEIHDENGDPILPNDVETEIDNIQSMFGFWTNAYLSALGNNPGGGGAELTLASLADVAVQGVADGQALVWNATLQKWVPGQGGGIDITAMWAALAQSGTQQIDASHLGTALTGYATETWVGNQGYITSSALNGYATENWVGSQISDMATQTWVSTNYLSKTDAASTYLTKTDANNTYLSIAFFRALFRAYTSGGSEVVPNGGSTSTIDNIKAMFGFWTNSYLSALGNNPGGASLTLASLADVAVQGVTDGQALVWSASQGKWVPGQGGGIDITAMWAALAQSGMQQIDASHLATALTGYATESWVGSQISDMATETWVGNQGYITGSALNGYATESWVGSQISDMATQTWVGQNYLGLHATADAATKLATARTLWGQSFDGTGNVSGDMSSVGNISFSASGKNIGGLMYFDTTNSNIGIGTSSPSYKLHVEGTGYYSSNLLVQSIDIGHGNEINATGSSNLLLQYRNSGDLVLCLNGANCGVGYFNPSYKLHVNGTFYASGNSSIGGTFGVTGATTLSSTLSVSGLITASGGITIPSGKTLTIGDAVLSWDSTNQGIKITKGLYSETFISALGKDSGGSSGISIEAVWTALANSDSSKQINASHLTNALAGYNPTSNFKTINGNSIIGTGDIAVSAGTGTVTSIVTGGTTYSPTNGVVTLPDYIVYTNENPLYLNASFLNAEYSQKAAQEYIEFWDSTGGWFNFKLGTLYAVSDVKVGSNSVIHAGNIGSQSVNYATSASKLETARTIWGQSFDGTGNVSGSLTGVENITSSSYSLHDSASNPYLNLKIGSQNWYVQSYSDGIYIGSISSKSLKVDASGNVTVVGTFGVSGATTLSSTLGVTGNTTLSGTLSVSKATTLSSTLGVTGATTLSSTLSVSGTSTLTGNVGIGTTPHSKYVLRANGEVYVSTGLTSHGYVTALSDIRHKDIQGDVGLTVSEVANAPAVKFLWKDRRQEGLQVGSIAQYWKKVLPEAIVEAADGELTMSYGVIALLASIANAREIVNLRREIAELKRKLQIN